VGPEQWVEPQQTTQTQAQMQAEGLAAPTAADSVGLGAVPPAERRLLSTVARPELILEGSFDPVGSKQARWSAIEFPHKPSKVSSSPTWVAPHQPRLDWSMWFAALGDQPPIWLVRLVAKLVQPPVPSSSASAEDEDTESWSVSPASSTASSEAVWSLLRSTDGVFNATHPPRQVRIRKAFLDFTRLDGCDSGRNAAAAVAASKGSQAKAQQSPVSHVPPSAWWRSTAPSKMFMPAQGSDSQVLRHMLSGGRQQQDGVPDQCAAMHAAHRRTRAVWNKAAASARASSNAADKAKALTKLEKLTPRLFPSSAPSASPSADSSFGFPFTVWSHVRVQLGRAERTLLPALPSSYGPYSSSLVRLLRSVRREGSQVSHLVRAGRPLHALLHAFTSVAAEGEQMASAFLRALWTATTSTTTTAEETTAAKETATTTAPSSARSGTASPTKKHLHDEL
jgi:hypothetical protein